MELKLKTEEKGEAVENTIHEQSSFDVSKDKSESVDQWNEDYGDKSFEIEDTIYVQKDIGMSSNMTEEELYKTPEMKKYRSAINTNCGLGYFCGGASILAGIFLYYLLGGQMLLLCSGILSAITIVVPCIIIQTKRIFGWAVFLLVFTSLNSLAGLVQGQISGILPLIISINLTIQLNEYRKHWKEYIGY